MAKFLYPILFEDQYILAVDKPSSIVTQSSEAYQNSLEEALRDHVKELGIEEGIERSGIAHRLDKGTSGVILIAKTTPILKYLQDEFKKRRIKKEYLAIVFGAPKDKSFIVDAPIGRHPTKGTSQSVSGDGRSAVTEFVVLDTFKTSFGSVSLIKAMPQTGRTHQIRVHLAAMGFPIVGDTLYSQRAENQKGGAHFSRILLHAKKLEFIHPITKLRVTVESETPKEFENEYINKL